jgi:hypothetical protein
MIFGLLRMWKPEVSSKKLPLIVEPTAWFIIWPSPSSWAYVRQLLALAQLGMAFYQPCSHDWTQQDLRLSETDLKSILWSGEWNGWVLSMYVIPFEEHANSVYTTFVLEGKVYLPSSMSDRFGDSTACVDHVPWISKLFFHICVPLLRLNWFMRSLGDCMVWR